MLWGLVHVHGIMKKEHYIETLRNKMQKSARSRILRSSLGLPTRQ